MARHSGESADVDVETSVRLVVGELLDIPAVAPHDDFFNLGGTSLTAIRTVAALRKEHGLEVPARQFMRDATISAIAAACRPVAR